MAKMAVQYSDQVIFTSDNPRYEDPDAIIEEMMLGLATSQQRKALSIVDRKNAIKVACQLANSGDIVLIAGKGHEAYQEIKGERFLLSDAAIVQEFLIAD
jgi:UDP-N-acetylmuramoyl-L-alanyl-D-glutamate--2,6-diaminopimelate ligase